MNRTVFATRPSCHDLRPRAVLSAALALALTACCGDDTASTAASDYGESASGATGWGTTGSSGGSSGGTTGWGTAGTSGDASGGATGSASEGTSDGTEGSSDGTDGTSDSTGASTGEPACDDQTPVTLYLSPDDSNSMSSPVQVREAVLGGFGGIAYAPIRVWEFFNYYTFPYPPAPKGEVVAQAELFQVEGAPDGEYLLQIAVTSEALTNAERAPMSVTLVLDESGSMEGPPMDLLKESCRAIAASLKAGDVVSMVGWDTQNAVKLAGYKVSGPNDATLLAEIEELAAGGGTDLHGGLVAGYDLASQTYDPARINRVVLISDGGANAGITDVSIIAGAAGSQDMDGIYLVGVGVGEAGGYNDALMDAVTDAGKGASVFIPDEAEAWKIFGDDFVNTMAVAARDVQVKLDLPPGFEIVTFSGEEYSGDPTEIEPQHLAPSDAMVFHQTIRTCAPDQVTPDTALTVTARYKDAVTFAVEEVSATVTFGELLGSATPLVRKGAAVMAYVEALKAVKSNAADAAERLATFSARHGEASALLPGDAELAEIKAVIEGL